MELENRRRTIIKSLLWRFIGLFWTWGGAYVIILLLPDKNKNAITVATLITAWHHSTRLIMYYVYERIWARVTWGKFRGENSSKSMTIRHKIQWIISTLIAIFIIFWLLFTVTPKIKDQQKEAIKQKIVAPKQLVGDKS